MGIKLLHTADWHLDSPFRGFSREQRQVLRSAQWEIPERIGEILRQEGCRLALLSGDIFDGAAEKSTLTHLASCLKEWAVPVFVSPGNHDYYGENSPWAEISWPENVHIFTGSPEFMDLPELNLRVYGAGYRSMDCPGLLGKVHAAPGINGIMVLHGDPTRPDSPYCPVTAAEIRGSGLRYLALGHIHQGGHILAGNTLCAWPGCPMGRGWDETGEKGVLIVELDDSVAFRFRPVSLPGFFDREISLAPGENAALALERVLPADSRDFWRITFTGTEAPDIPALEKRYPNGVFRDRTHPQTDLWAGADADTLEGVYFSLLRQQGTTGELAARISRRILEGWEVPLP